MKRKHRKLGNRVQLVVDEVLHLLGHSLPSGADVARGRSLQLTRLEERVLMSASPMAMVAEVATVATEAAVADSTFHSSESDAVDAGAVDLQIQSAESIDGGIYTDAADTTSAVQGIELIVIDSRVQDPDTLLSELLNTDRDFRILRLDAEIDGIAQITDKLAQLGNVSAIHLLTHGADGEILLGSTVLNASTLAQHAPDFLAWQHNLTADADLLLYGCDVAQTTEGQDFIKALAQLTDADVSASEDETGQAALGGDWDLEQTIGVIDTSIAFTEVSQLEWQGLLSLNAYESFSYSAGSLEGTNGGTGWSTAWTKTVGSTANVIATGLTSPSGLPTAQGGAAEMNTTLIFEQGRDLSAAIGADGTTKWFSFLLKPDGTSLGMSLMIGDGVGAANSVNVGTSGSDFLLGMDNTGAGAKITNAVINGQTYFLVVRIDFSAGNDVVRLYLNPTAGLSSPDSLPAATAQLTTADLGTFTRIGMIGGALGNNSVMDEIRIGDTFADVAGGGTNQPPTANAGGPYTINEGNSLTVDGSGSSDPDSDPLTYAWDLDNDGIYNESGEPLTQSGTVSWATLQSFGITPGATFTVGLQVSDGNGGSASTTTTLTVIDVNAAPVNSVPSTQTTSQNTTLTFSTANGNAISVSDSDAGTNPVSVTLTATNGTTSLAWPSGAASASGSELLVNTTTANEQAMLDPSYFGATTGDFASPRSVASNAAGDFVVTWSSNAEDGHGWGVYAQRYNAAGVALGSSFLVNSTTANDQVQSSVAIDDSGNFVITWSSDNQDGDGWGVYAQRFNATGVAQGSQFRVNSYTTKDQLGASIAMDAFGHFVISWSSKNQDSDNWGIYAQRYNAAGVAQGGEFRVNNTTDKEQTASSIAMAEDGSFVVTWASHEQDNGNTWGIYGKRFNASGVAQGTEFRINTTTDDDQQFPSVAMDAIGNFVVTWSSKNQDGDTWGVYAQRYNSTGVRQGSEFLVNTTSTREQMHSTVAMDTDGDFVITWSSNNQDGSASGIYARQYNAAGVAKTGETLVNTTTSADQAYSSVAMDARGDFVVVWTGNGAGDSTGTFGQRFVVPASVTLTSGDGTRDSAITFSGSQSQVNAALNGLRFTPTTGFNGTATLTILTNDQGNSGTGGPLIDTDTVNITVGTSNAAPALTLSGGALTWTENGAASVIDSSAILTDSDSPNLSGGTLTVYFSSNGTTSDVLAIRNQGTSSGQIGVSGSNVTYNAGSGAVTIGSFSGGNDGVTPLVVTFNTSATPTAVQALLRNITFQNTSDAPSTLTRTATFIVTDGDGGTSNTASKSINVTAVNDAPVLTAGPVSLGTIAANQTSPVMTVNSLVGTSITDNDSNADFTPLAGIAVFGTTGTGTWQYSLDGTTWNSIPAVTVTQALLLRDTDSLRFVGSGTVAGSATITFAAWDQTGVTAGQQGTTANLSTLGTGGSAPFSTVANTAMLTLSLVNTAPIANGESYTLNEGGTLTVNGVSNWFNPNWQYRQQLVFNNSASSTNVVDAAVLVKLHASALDAIHIDYAATQNAGEDLRFVDTNGTVLAYEIEQWNETGYSYVWVKVPQIDAGSTTDSIFMYYGNATATSGQSPSAVWSANDVAVFHMNSNSVDSTSYGNSGASTSVFAATGVVAGAGTFDGLNSRINALSDASVDNIFAGGGAISAWINPVSWGEGGYGRIADKGTTTTGTLGWGFQVAGTTSSDGYLIFENDFTSNVGRWRTAAGSVAQNAWQNVAIVYDNSSAANIPKFYINGVQVAATQMSAPSGTTRTDAAQDLYIGNRSGASDRTFSGRMDEIRFSSTALTADQVKAHYKSVAGTLISSSGVVAGPAGLLENDSDPENNNLTVSLVSGPAHASSFSLNPDGSFNYVHDGSETTTDSFTYRVSDGTLTSTATVSLSITPVNRNSPVISSNGGDATAAISVAENTTGVTTVVATDADLPAQTLTYSISGADASKFSINASTGELTFVTAPNFEVPTDNGTNNVYNVTVQVTDGTFSDTQAIEVTVTAVNDNTPVITSNGSGATAAISVAENTMTVTTVTATDVDLPAQTLTYSISGGSDAAKFSINASSGELTFVTAPNFEVPTDNGTNNVYNVTVRVTDGTFSDTQAVAVTVTAVNDNTPVITSNGAGATAAISVAENTTGVTTVVATDADLPAQTLTYSISGADASKFSINASTGELTFVTAPNFEVPTDNGTNNVYNVTVQITDGTFSDTQAIEVTVTAVNDNTPVITSNGSGATAGISVAENTTTVTTVTATDADLPAQTLTYSISGGSDAAKFSINASTGELTFVTAPNFEVPTDNGTNNVYNVTVRVTDGTRTDTQAIEVTVTNVNESPSMTVTQTVFTIAEDAATSPPIEIGTITVSDDALGTNSLTLTGADASSFQIVAGNKLRLRSGTALDANTHPVLSVTINLNDPSLSGSPISSQTVTLSISDVDEPPTANAGGPYIIAEGDSLTVAAGPSVDPEGLPLTYAWDIDGDGQFDDANGSSATLTWTQLGALSIPVNDNASRTVALRVTDAGGNSTTATTSLTINDTPPTIIVTGNANTTSGAPYTINIAATDPGRDTITSWRVNWGDGTIQTVAGTSSTASHTYTVPGGTRSITLTGTDENGTHAMTGGPLVVSVANNAPTAPELSDMVVPGLINGANVGTLSYTDPDTGDSHTWIVSDNRFTVVGTTLKLKTSQQINPVAEPTVTLTVTVTDAGGLSNASVFVLRVNNPPVSVADVYAVDATQQLSISSPSLGVLANDTDADGDTLTANLISGPSHAAAFGLNANGTFWYRAAVGFSGLDTFTYRATDGENPGAVTTVGFNVNQPATIDYHAILWTIPEHQTLTAPLQVGTVGLNDDGIGTNTVTLTGPDAALFELDSSNNLFLKSGLTIDFSVQSQFDVTVNVDDPLVAGSPDAMQRLIFSVGNLNEAPTATVLPNVVVSEDAAPGNISTAFAFSDPDGDTLTYSIQVASQSPGLIRSININQTTGDISYSLNADAFGTATLRVVGRDPSDASVARQFQLTVQPVSDPPIVRNYFSTTFSDEMLVVSGTGVLASATDADFDAMTVALVSAPVNGTVVLNASGGFVYTPHAGFHGVDTFRFVASDGSLASNIGTATITVVPQFVGSQNGSTSGNGSSSTQSSTSSSTGTASSSSGTSSTAPVTSGPGNSGSKAPATGGGSGNSNTSGDALLAGMINPALPGSASASDNDGEDDFMGALPSAETTVVKRILPASEQESGENVDRNDPSDFVRRTSENVSAHDFDAAFSQLESGDAQAGLNREREILYRQIAARVDSRADSVTEQLEQTEEFKGRVVGSVGVVTTGFSVGYLFWAVRLGTLASGLLAQVPAWSMLDPLLVIDGDQKDDDKESLQNIMDRQQAKLNKTEADGFQADNT